MSLFMSLAIRYGSDRSLTNLVSNGIKFTNNGIITIEFSLVKQKNRRVEILLSLNDTDLGIPADKQVYIFERFAQANSKITR